MGHIVAMDDSPAQLALTGYGQRLWDERGEQLPASGERVVCGTLWIAGDEEEMAEARRKLEVYQRCGLKAMVVDGKALRWAEPELREGLAGGLLVPGDSVVYPPPICAAMLETVKRSGGEVVLGKRVAGMTGRGVRLADGSVLSCEYAVNAAGVGAARLTAGFEVRPRKGHLVITDRYPGFVRHQLVELGYLKSAHSSTGSSVAFNVQPRPNGQVLIGSSRQFGEESGAVDHGILSQMLRRAMEYMPGISGLSAIRCWTGFRAATPDKLPLIGPHPEDGRLFLATGHEGLGITTSLATGRLVADLMAGRETAIAAGPYLPARCFAGASVGH